MEMQFKANNFFFKNWTLKDDRLIFGSREIMLEDIVRCEEDYAVNKNTSSGTFTFIVKGKSSPRYLTTRAGLIRDAIKAFEYIIEHSSDERSKKKLAKENEEIKKYGSDYYMQCDLCKYIFHYTQQDLYNDAKAEYEAAKQQISGGLNMVLGNAYMGQRDVRNAEEKSSRIVDRNKCPKCGCLKLNRLTEDEAKVEMAKQNTPTQVVAETSAAEEIKKYKDLLDSGIITQEEFDAKKKQLLGL